MKPGFIRLLLTGLGMSGLLASALAQTSESLTSAALPEHTVVPVVRSEAPGGLLGRAEQAMNNGEYLRALDVLRDVLREQPTHQQARFMAAHAMAQVGQQREAVTLLEELAKEDPRNFTYLNNLAWLLAISREPGVRHPGRAVELARQALLSAPDNYSVWSTLSEAYYQAGDYHKAVRAAEEAWRTGQAQSAPQDKLATYQEQMRKCQQAVEAFSLIER